MNRRKFLGNTAMAAALVSIAPSAIASDLSCKKKNTLVFVFRGVSFLDAETSIKKVGLLDNNAHLQKVICENPLYTHAAGIQAIVGSYQSTILATEKTDRYKIPEVISDVINTKTFPMVHLHHTEIGHSSNKLYQETLDHFFTELKKVYDPQKHKIIVTADLGRNEKLNSCGGKDHSNNTCLETFVLFLGGKSSKLKANTAPLKQQEILQQKF